MIPDNNVYIIAEAGVNHDGDVDKAHSLIDAAAQSGADAVKFQTFNAKKMTTSKAPKASYQKETTDKSESQLEMLSKLELSPESHHDLKDHAKSLGIEFLSTAFDLGSLKFLETLNLPIYKIPSGEITNAPLLWAFANTKKPLVISTGMATLSEVEQALAIAAHGMLNDKMPKNLEEVWKHWSTLEAQTVVSENVTLLHCTSQYPTPMEQVNLRAMDALNGAFGLPVGYSDHTKGILVPVAAVARGAVIIEKHFTLDRDSIGPDHKASLEPKELGQMVEQIRDMKILLGSHIKSPHQSEWDTRRVARQSLIVKRAINVGDIFNEDCLGTARSSSGVNAAHYWDYIGTEAMQDYSEGDAL